MENNFKSVESAAVNTITKISTELDKLDKKLLTLNANLANMAKMGGASSPNELTNTIKKYEDQFKQFTETIKKQEEQIKKLNANKSQLEKTTKKSKNASLIENETRKKSLASLRLQANANNKLITAYERLIAQQKRMKAELNNLIVTKGKDAEATKRMQSAYDKVTNKTNLTNKAFISLSKGGIRGAVGGIKSLVGAFGIFGGATLVANLIPNIYNLTKTFDALKFSMEKTIPDAIELGETQEFLDDITQRYGSDLVTTTERYIKFNAAAKQSGLELKKTQEIFGSVTKAAGVLGLKTDELQGVYLALEQMLSKGKVTTEELRRQLGERLPGAFGIMADALDVSVSKLDKMLKKGEILSADALPKFAVALEKAYGIESVKKIDTLQAAQTRLSNAWSMFVRDISGSDSILQSVFKGTLSFMSGVLESISGIAEEIKEAFKTDVEKVAEKNLSGYQKLFKKVEDGLNSIKDANERINTAVSDRFRIEESLANRIFENEKKVSGVKNANIDFAKSQAKLIVENISLHKDYESLINDLGLREDIYDKSKIARTFAKIRAIDKVIKTTEDLLEKEEQSNEGAESGAKKVTKAIIEKRKYQEGSIDDIRNQINELEKLTNATEHGSMQWHIYNELLKALKHNFDILVNGVKEVKKEIEKPPKYNTEDFFDLQIKKLEEEKSKLADTAEEYALYEQLIKNVIAAKQKLIGVNEEQSKSEDKFDFFEKFKGDVFSNAGFDFLGGILTDLDGFTAKIDALADDDKWKGYFVSIAEVAQETFNFLNSQQDYYFERQYERLEQQKDIAIQFAGDSATAKEEIERQYDAKRKQIEREQAKAKKKSAVFNILIDTAQAVIGFLANPGGPQGVGLSIAAGVIGAAQAAIVSSTNVPEFFRGTMNAPEGWAMVDEKQPEIHTDRQGNIKSFGEQGANMRYLSAGDKIYKSHDEWLKTEYKDVLNQNGMLEYNGMMEMVMPSINIEQGLKKEDFVREIRSMKEAIMSKETSVTNIDKNGFHTFNTKNGIKKNRLNNILRIKGGIV